MEIKEGMHVRTKDGELFQCLMINIDENNPSLNRFMNEWGNIIMFDEIDGEPSYDIFDLIKPGDYVNGLKVHGITDYGLEVYMFGDCKEILYEHEIKSIVTKERFKSVEYEVKHESTN